MRRQLPVIEWYQRWYRHRLRGMIPYRLENDRYSGVATLYVNLKDARILIRPICVVVKLQSPFFQPHRRHHAEGCIGQMKFCNLPLDCVDYACESHKSDQKHTSYLLVLAQGDFRGRVHPPLTPSCSVDDLVLNKRSSPPAQQPHPTPHTRYSLIRRS
jgi:hypothetical protein